MNSAADEEFSDQMADDDKCQVGINKQTNETDHTKVWPPSLVAILHQTIATPCQHPSKPIFDFDLSVKAADKNLIILIRKFGRRDLHKALDAFKTLLLAPSTHLQESPKLGQDENGALEWINMAALTYQ